MDIDQHQKYMRLALAQARKSPPKPTNYCVGALLVSPSTNVVLATGYTLECAGNTHAEQCCFLKYAQAHSCKGPEIGLHLPRDVVLYTTMEPCNKRSVGNTPCVDRVLALKQRDGRQAISTVYVGVSEPETFVGENTGTRRLRDAGIEVVHVAGIEEEILAVATAGHGETPGHTQHEVPKVGHSGRLAS